MKQTQNQYYGLLREKPSTLPAGSTFISTNTQEVFLYDGPIGGSLISPTNLAGLVTDASLATSLADYTTTASLDTSVTTASYSVSAIQTAPATATSAGVAGTIVVAVDAIYVCTATNVWVKAALATF